MEDFNIPGPERIAVLESLQEAMGPVPKHFWAACQICDIKALNQLVELAHKYPAQARILARQTQTMVPYWTHSSAGMSRTTTPKKSKGQLSGLSSSPADLPSAKRQKTTGSPGDMSSTSPEISRSRPNTALARERDSGRCVLTGSLSTDVAHIYAMCKIKAPEHDMYGARHIFWDNLRCFWPEEKIAAWEAELFPRGLSEPGNEMVQNLITLSKDVHEYWNRGAFALKPISLSEDQTSLKLQFFWQNKQTETEPVMSPVTIPLSTQDLDHNEGAFELGNCEMFNHRSRSRIKSGDIFELTTTDTAKKPLPSFILLELQWFLTRVVGMAGAAYGYELGLGDYDSDDEVSNPGLDEAGDTSFVSIDELHSPQFLRQVNQALKHHVEDEERDGDGDRAGELVM